MLIVTESGSATLGAGGPEYVEDWSPLNNKKHLLIKRWRFESINRCKPGKKLFTHYVLVEKTSINQVLYRLNLPIKMRN